MKLAASLLGGCGLLLGACAGFPHRQPPPDLTAMAPLDGVDAMGGGAWPDAHWWRGYQDSTLDELIELGNAGSPTLASAHARFESAEQSVRLAAASSGLHVDANFDIERQRLSDNGFIPPRLLGFNWYNQANLGLDLKYTFDWWGKQKYAVESAIDSSHAAQADRSAAQLLLAASISDAYFGWQADQTRLRLAHEREETVSQERQIAVARVGADLDISDTIHRADLSLAAAREQAAALDGSAKLRLVMLAALVGRSVAELPGFTVRDLPSVSGALPDSVKIDLIARRADIIASRWRVESAEKNLASARAEFFPDISLNALAGLQTVDIGKLLNYGSRVPLIEAAVHLPVFDAGRLRAQYGAASASIDAAVSTYRDTVIDATREVGTQVTTLNQLDAQRVQRQAQLDAARRIQDVAAARVQQGLSDSRSVLTAAETVLDERDALLQLAAAAVSADIALKRALGGGYENPDKFASSK